MLAERLRECHKQLYKLRIESLQLNVDDPYVDDFTQEELERWLENLLIKSKEPFFKYVFTQLIHFFRARFNLF